MNNINKYIFSLIFFTSFNCFSMEPVSFDFTQFTDDELYRLVVQCCGGEDEDEDKENLNIPNGLFDEADNECIGPMLGKRSPLEEFAEQNGATKVQPQTLSMRAQWIRKKGGPRKDGWWVYREAKQTNYLGIDFIGFTKLFASSVGEVYFVDLKNLQPRSLRTGLLATPGEHLMPLNNEDLRIEMKLHKNAIYGLKDAEEITDINFSFLPSQSHFLSLGMHFSEPKPNSGFNFIEIKLFFNGILIGELRTDPFLYNNPRISKGSFADLSPEEIVYLSLRHEGLEHEAYAKTHNLDTRRLDRLNISALQFIKLKKDTQRRRRTNR